MSTHPKNQGLLAGKVAFITGAGRGIGAASVVKLHGRLDVAFNNAAIVTPPGPMLDMSEADFDRLTTVNDKSVWLSMREEIKAIRPTARKGAIVNNSSVGGWRSAPTLAAAWLLSDRASYVTGAILPVDGGSGT